jgi:hypothetical protein
VLPGIDEEVDEEAVAWPRMLLQGGARPLTKAKQLGDASLVRLQRRQGWRE